jgi:putative hydrolase of the HAD superfamily
MSAWQHLRLIPLDLDDTLWPCAPVIQAAEVAHHAWLAAQAPRLTERHTLQSLREHRRRLMHDRPEIAHDVTALREASLMLLLAELDYTQAHAVSLTKGAMEAFRRARNQVEPYPDVAPVLSRLRRHCRLVAVTNGNAEVQHTPLRDAFDRCLTAAEAGAAKPDPALFQLAMDWAEATPEQTLHVGDDPERDIEAARRLGLPAVWVNRAGQTWPEQLPPPTYRVADLNALEQWLGFDEAAAVTAASAARVSGTAVTQPSHSINAHCDAPLGARQ